MQIQALRRPAGWFLIALLVRLPALWRHEHWTTDPLGFLYFGSALLHGNFLDLGEGQRAIPPCATLLLGLGSYLPVSLQIPWGFLQQALLGAAWVFPVHALTRRRFGDEAATWSAALTALLHPLTAVAAQFNGIPIYLLALLGALAALESDSPNRRRWTLLLSPIAALSRSEGLFVVLPAMTLAALHFHRGNDSVRRNVALQAGCVTLLAAVSYGAFLYLQTGDLQFAPIAKSTVGMAAVRDLSSDAATADYHALQKLGSAEFFMQIAGRLPPVIFDNLRWWWLGALPAALGLLFPALLGGLWLRCRTWWEDRPRWISSLDGLDGIILANLAIFLLAARFRHHVPLVLVALLPYTAAFLVRWQRSRPRWLVVAATLSLLWTGYHWIRAYANSPPEDLLPAYRIGQRLRAPAASNDFAALDGAGRQDWLGRSDIPLVRPGADPSIWLDYQRHFPQIRFAIYNPNIPDSPPPPGDWPLFACMTEENPRVMPVCAYRIPGPAPER